MMTHRTYSAKPLHHHCRFPVRAALDEFFETTEFNDMQAHLMDAIILVQQQRHFAMPLDTGHRIDRHTTEFFW